MKYKNILIIQTAFIGDAILASCLIEKLHHHFPESSVSILVRKGNDGIYQSHPFLKDILVWNKKEDKFKNLFRLLGRIRRNRYDCVINCHRYASSGFLTAFSGAAHTAGFKQNPFSFLFNFSIKHSIEKGLHETQRYHQLISDFTGPDRFLPKLYPSAEDELQIKSLLTRPFVCLAPASVWFTKQLPFKKWVELCDLLPTETRIYLLGADGDKALCEKIVMQSKHTDIQNLCGQLSLLQSSLLMKHAEMNFVNDSAPLHLASSLNAPVTVFFLSTSTDFGFGPLSTKNRVIEVKGLDCRPCGLHGYRTCPKEHFNCAEKIEITGSLASF